MNRNPVDWFEIYVTDMPRARAFYEAVLAVKLEKLSTNADGISEMWSFPRRQDAPGAAGALVKMPGGPEGGGASTIVYFLCEDCAAEAARAPKNGGSLMKPKFSIGEHGFIALVKDTEGNVVGLHSLK
jgi:predicted enzyme related to lactoylglutathione lyase